jgi:hypothetical protein
MAAIPTDNRFGPPLRKGNGQFRKGTSGNPSGRSANLRRTPSTTQLAIDVLDELERARSRDPKRRSAVTLLVREEFKRALAGDRGATKRLIDRYLVAISNPSAFPVHEPKNVAPRSTKDETMMMAIVFRNLVS